jgi:hypothetical protein
VVPNLSSTTQTDSLVHISAFWCDDGGLTSGSRADSLNHIAFATTYGWYTRSPSCWEGDTSSATLKLGILEGHKVLTVSIANNYNQRSTVEADFGISPISWTPYSP